jgi:hypothetical protein
MIKEVKVYPHTMLPFCATVTELPYAADTTVHSHYTKSSNYNPVHVQAFTSTTLKKKSTVSLKC